MRTQLPITPANVLGQSAHVPFQFTWIHTQHNQVVDTILGFTGNGVFEFVVGPQIFVRPGRIKAAAQLLRCLGLRQLSDNATSIGVQDTRRWRCV